MKNKKGLYLLLIATLLVWGLIIYRIFFHTGLINSTKEDSSSNVQQLPGSHNYCDTFSLILGYPDPFLKQNSKFRRHQSFLTSKFKGKNALQLNPKVKHSEIEYLGIVKNKDTKKKIGILDIDGSEATVREGFSNKNYSVGAISKVEITLKSGDSSKIIKKKLDK